MADPFASVLVDACLLSNHGATGGIGTYIRNLLGALASRPDLAVAAMAERAAPVPRGVARRSIVRPTARTTRARAQVIEHAALLPLDAWRLRRGGEVFHNPAFHAPLGVGHPWVQTLHDVIPLAFDSDDLAPLRRRWARFGPRYRLADAVIAVSRHSADEGIRRLGVEPRRIQVAYQGIDPHFVPGPPDEADPPYVLVVSEYSRRKGFADAFWVVDALANAGYPHRLKVAGKIHPWARAELAGLRACARHPERIELLGYVPDLPTLYHRAAVFLMCSRYEGFGLPPLEALACGIPTVAYANSAVTEVVGDGGILVADGDREQLLAAVRGLLDSPTARAEWRERGPAHARQFSWERSAAIHAEVYRSVS